MTNKASFNALAWIRCFSGRKSSRGGHLFRRVRLGARDRKPPVPPFPCRGPGTSGPSSLPLRFLARQTLCISSFFFSERRGRRPGGGLKNGCHLSSRCLLRFVYFPSFEPFLNGLLSVLIAVTEYRSLVELLASFCFSLLRLRF